MILKINKECIRDGLLLRLRIRIMSIVRISINVLNMEDNLLQLLSVTKDLNIDIEIYSN
jgi:hypothetical protein